MKKLSICVLATFMMFAVLPAQLYAGSKPTPAPMASTTPVESEVVHALSLRLTEIKEQDKTNLSRTEKKALRKEIRTIKSELKASGDGVYLSVGVLLVILIVVLLILLL